MKGIARLLAAAITCCVLFSTTEANDSLRVDSTKVTSSGKWATEILAQAESELSQLKTGEDAAWWVKHHANEFVREFYNGTKGTFEEVGYGLRQRVYSDDDNKVVVLTCRRLAAMVDNVEAKYNLTTNPKMKGVFADIEMKAARRLTYSWKREKEALKKAREDFGR